MSKRKRISIHDAIIRYTPEEIAENNRIYELKDKLGLIPNYYDSNTSDNGFIPSMYTCYGEYLEDKIRARRLIDNKQEIPKDLYNRLVQAKAEIKKHNIHQIL